MGYLYLFLLSSSTADVSASGWLVCPYRERLMATTCWRSQLMTGSACTVRRRCSASANSAFRTRSTTRQARSRYLENASRTAGSRSSPASCRSPCKISRGRERSRRTSASARPTVRRLVHEFRLVSETSSITNSYAQFTPPVKQDKTVLPVSYQAAWIESWDRLAEYEQLAVRLPSSLGV